MSNPIGIGINENVVVGASTTWKEEGSLNLVFKEKAQEDLFAAMTSGEGMSDSEVSVRLFPISMNDFDGNQKPAATIGKELIAHRDMLGEILSMFMDTAAVNSSLNMSTILASVGINEATKATLNTRLLSEDFAKAVFEKISKTFIQACTPHFEKSTFRLKLVRATKEKNFPRIPMSKFKEPWIESMQIPLASSELGFSQWEIENGKNSRAAAQADQTSAASTKAAEAAFGGVPAGAEPIPTPGMAAPAPAPAPAPVEVATPVVEAAPVVAQPVAAPVAQPAAAPTPAPFPGQQPVG